MNRELADVNCTTFHSQREGMITRGGEKDAGERHLAVIGEKLDARAVK